MGLGVIKDGVVMEKGEIDHSLDDTVQEVGRGDVG